MPPVTIKFVKTHNLAVLPKYNNVDQLTGDSGMDVVAVEDVTIPYRGKKSSTLGKTRIVSPEEKEHFQGYSPSDVGDLVVTVKLDPWAVVPVGLKLAYITPGYWFRVEGRSGMGFKKHVFPHFGIIDSGYRGDMGIKLYNYSNVDVVIKAGDKIAQLIVYPLIQANVDWATEVTESVRGAKGFGSSDGKPIKLLPNEVMVDGVITEL